MSPKSITFTSKDILLIILGLWFVAPAVWLFLHISGFEWLDGLFGVYYNQPWQETLAKVAAFLLPLSALAAIIISVIGRKLRSITTRSMVGYILLSFVVPLVLSSATAWFPIRFKHPSNVMCSQGQYSGGIDCSYRLKIGY